MNKRRTAGFTLLEVLIALAVFALSAFAVLRQISQSVQQSQYLEQKTYALWIAEGRLAEYRSAKDWPSLGRHSQTIDQYNQNWWLEVEVSNTSDSLLRRVEVRVGEEGAESSIIILQGFLGKH